jgi:hypothetical protein
MKSHKTWQDELHRPREGGDDVNCDISSDLPEASFLAVFLEYTYRMLSHEELLNLTCICKQCSESFSQHITRVTTPRNAFLFNRRFYFVCKRFPNVEHIRTRDHVGETGIQEISRALALGVLPKLKSIRLGGSTIGDTGIVELANAIQAGKRLSGSFNAHASVSKLCSFPQEGLETYVHLTWV